MALYNMSSLQSLVLADGTLGNNELVELAPALYHNTSIDVLDLSRNILEELESAEIVRDILRSNKTMTALDLSGTGIGWTAVAVDYIADGLGSNSTLLKIDLSDYSLDDDGLSILSRTLGSRNTTLQKLLLNNNAFGDSPMGVLLEALEQNNNSITDLYLRHNWVGPDGMSFLARSLETTCYQTSHISLFFKVISAAVRSSLRWCRLWSETFRCSILMCACAAVSVSDLFWPWRRVYQRSKCCNELT
jgi:hypothetical protein